MGSIIPPRCAKMQYSWKTYHISISKNQYKIIFRDKFQVSHTGEVKKTEKIRGS